MNTIQISIIFSIITLLAVPLSAGAVDHSIYVELLGKYVSDEGMVNYAGFKREEAKLDRYLEILENTDPSTLSRDERFAFYVNAYNSWTIKLILSEYPDIDSIKDLGSAFGLITPWKKEIARIDGEVLTLDHIEHDILRPEFKDPRVHFAINCAAKSCPPLLNEPYTGEKLDYQLDRQTSAFINDPEETYLEGGTLHVSRIFKWFGEDFDNDPLSFVLKYADGEFKQRLQANKENIEVEYLDYDWSLNGT